MISVPLSENEGQVTGPVQRERTLWIRMDLTLSEWKCTAGFGEVGGRRAQGRSWHLWCKFVFPQPGWQLKSWGWMGLGKECGEK